MPLLSTGNSRTVSHLFGRYFGLNACEELYEGDIWDINHTAHHSIMQVLDPIFMIQVYNN